MANEPEDVVAKITSIAAAPVGDMNDGKGTVHRLVGPQDGARAVDVHVNVIKAGTPPAPYHVHDRAENIYIVLEGVAEAIVDGVVHRLGPHDVAFIPPGVPHAAGSTDAGPVTLIEIYAPAGPDFRRISPPSGPQAAGPSAAGEGEGGAGHDPQPPAA